MQHLQRLQWLQRHFEREKFWRCDKGEGDPLWRHCLLLFEILVLEVLEVLEMLSFKAFAKSPVGCRPRLWGWRRWKPLAVGKPRSGAHQTYRTLPWAIPIPPFRRIPPGRLAE
jgi:hypothetical protein